MTGRPVRAASAALVLGLLAGACTGGGEPTPAEPSPTRPTASASPTESPAEESSAATPSPSETSRSPSPVSVPALFERTYRGGGLRLGAVREQTAAYTSYDVTYRSDDLTISGVLNVPAGRGPFPAVVLAHGYIDPAYYVRGQGMTRERGYLAERGFVALHVDYRNHAESSDDASMVSLLRLGYAVDVINAVHALRRTQAVPVDDDRLFLMGRSMGGGVVQTALVAQPGLVSAAAQWAPVSSRAAENFDRWIRRDPGRSGLVDAISRRFGLPEDAPRFWREMSPRTYFHRVTEPVLTVQGGSDDTCPPRWARATHRALLRAGADSTLAWYADEEHAFGPRFFGAMDRTVAFFRASSRG
ncbi:peptidase S9 [Nocardioides gansuensis]|uniref:Peptidase S9 n=1 Tax=Nocardioides gansuensis TaxID=2138300 RepID=A0A2T8F546_9ACTN|nr:alpha/beta fold hydrolase [Nocardioides gansuensis]PVG80838.1 peptidase S9 [Nocardioides gansuensis]